MPRKKKHQDAFKKTSLGYVHPAMEAAADSPTPHLSESSVNARIEYLRGVQSRPQVSITSDELLLSTHAPVRQRKRMAGPPPPRSWLEQSTSKASLSKRGLTRGRGSPDFTQYLPGIMLPDKNSLVHLSLKSLALNWDEQVDFLGDWLSTIPRHLKSLLLTYIARYGPEEGMSITGLRLLMSSDLDTGSESSTGCHDITRLDLGGALGRRINEKQLRAYLLSAGGKGMRISPRKSKAVPPESWEEDAPYDLSLSRTSLGPSVAFCKHLTHLTLEDPGPVSWADFVDLVSPHLGRVTHLSLARWPSPKPDNVLPDATRGAPISEADMETLGRYRLQALSRHTSQLQYLCLGGCHTWFDLFRPATPTYQAPRTQPRTVAAFGDEHAPSYAKNPGADVPDQIFVHTWRKVVKLDLTDTSCPVPGPDSLGSLTLRDTLCKREPFMHPDKAQTIHELIRVPTADGGSRLVRPDCHMDTCTSLHAEARRWIFAEHENMKLVRFIKQMRGRGHGLTAEYGCSRDDLLAAGWSEAVLFGCGL